MSQGRLSAAAHTPYQVSDVATCGLAKADLQHHMGFNLMGQDGQTAFMKYSKPLIVW